MTKGASLRHDLLLGVARNGDVEVAALRWLIVRITAVLRHEDTRSRSE